MQSQRLPFLRDIAANSRDEAPRLIYADWLDERGDAQGEFIRVQCQLANDQMLTTSQRNELRARELQLLRQFGKGWAGPVRELVKRWRFERGMVTGVRIDTATFLNEGPRLLEMAPILDIDFLNAFNYLDELGSTDQIIGMRSIGFPHCNFGAAGNSNHHFQWPADRKYNWEEYLQLSQAFQNEQSSQRSRTATRLQAFFERSAIRELMGLRLAHNCIGDEGLATLCNCAALSQLESLDLQINGLSSVGLDALIRSSVFVNLRELFLAGCKNLSHSYDEDEVGPLPIRLGELLPRLNRLSADQCGLTEQSMNLVNQAVAPQLEHLSLCGNMIGGNEQTTLHSPLFQSLLSLNMDSCYLNGERLQEMFVGERLLGLNELTLANNPLGPAAAKAIANAKLPNLCRLVLDGQARSELTDKGVQALFQSTSLPNLSVLSVRRQKLSDASIDYLLSSPMLQQLYSIDLSGNEITDRGAETLAAHGPWPRLASINLRGNSLSSAAKVQLRKQFDYRVLYE